MAQLSGETQVQQGQAANCKTLMGQCVGFFPSIFHGLITPGSHRTGYLTGSLWRSWSISVGSQGVLQCGFPGMTHRFLALSQQRRNVRKVKGCCSIH